MLHRMQNGRMKTRVTSRGVLIPKRLLEGIDEVEIRKENDLILVIPLAADDPIMELGEQPIVGDVTDASEKHDQYLYN
jgi:hypothetical protein